MEGGEIEAITYGHERDTGETDGLRVLVKVHVKILCRTQGGPWTPGVETSESSGPGGRPERE